MKICPQCSELYPDDAGFCPLDGTKLVVSTDPLLGRTISSRYRLTKKLGMGGMAVVYLARHVMIDRLNAIKILRRDLSLDPNQRERFLREARAVNRINHPNIVEITDFGEFEGTAYLVMEYSPAESLLQLMKRGPLAWDRVVRIAEQIASALSRAHEAGVIHRDLKPENVLILDPPQGGTAERVKLTDFGIAKIIDAPALTFSEQMFGTPGYIAPEYVEGVKADGRADLFSLGVLMYESMTGLLPWDAKGQAELLLRPLTAAPTPLHDRIEVPPELDSLVLALLAKKADDRPPDAFVVHDALLDILRRYAPSRSAPPPPSSGYEGRDAIPTTVTEVESLDERPPMSTAEIGRVQTSELASRWGGAIADIEVALARARKKGISETTAQRTSELAAHARSLVEKLERASAKVAEVQGRVDRLQAHAREFRANLGRAIDEVGRDRARERSHWSALRTRHDELEVERGPAASQREAQVWEAAALSAEEEHVKSVEEDLTFQIVQLQLQLEAKNERFEKEYASATGELEGSISAVRAMTHEIVRTLDEATAIVTARKKR
ncbi:MAG TPA: serine/threonine-protein kinase [Polyangiaceae bacterium]|nr:serine/threonine-protein kinase [Polyangiaceae bacterium]